MGTTPFHQQTMPQHRSKLFQRNNGGKGHKGPGLYANRRLGGFYPPNPIPPKGAMAINRLEVKQRTFNGQSNPAWSESPTSQLDIIAQGTQVGQRIGQRAKVTGVHIRGEMRMPAASLATDDTAGYYLVWDKSPNGSLASRESILDVAGGVSNADAFPLTSNGERFIILARKVYNLIKSEAESADFVGRSTVDDYYQFRKPLVSTTFNLDEGSFNNDGTVATRSQGALLLLPFGNNDQANATTFTFGYRLYFTDV